MEPTPTVVARNGPDLAQNGVAGVPPGGAEDIVERQALNFLNAAVGQPFTKALGALMIIATGVGALIIGISRIAKAVKQMLVNRTSSTESKNQFTSNNQKDVS